MCERVSKRGQVAQVVERSPEKAGVGGSTPSLATIISKQLHRISKIASVRIQSAVGGSSAAKDGLKYFPLGRHPVRAYAVCVQLQRSLHVRMP